MSAAPSGSLPPLSEEERAIFANAIRQARMLQRTLGPLCEVAIHDFRDLDHSLVHLEGSLTGRKLGAPITNIVVKAWRQQGDSVADIVGYPSSTPGGKSLKSSTSFLRRVDGRVIGAFCMNIDLSDLLHFQAVMHPLLHVDPLERDASETFAACTGDTRNTSCPMAMAAACQTVSQNATASRRRKNCLFCFINCPLPLPITRYSIPYRPAKGNDLCTTCGGSARFVYTFIQPSYA